MNAATKAMPILLLLVAFSMPGCGTPDTETKEVEEAIAVVDAHSKEFALLGTNPDRIKKIAAESMSALKYMPASSMPSTVQEGRGLIDEAWLQALAG